jgi:hypothetical protein
MYFFVLIQGYRRGFETTGSGWLLGFSSGLSSHSYRRSWDHARHGLDSYIVKIGALHIGKKTVVVLAKQNHILEGFISQEDKGIKT